MDALLRTDAVRIDRVTASFPSPNTQHRLKYAIWSLAWPHREPAVALPADGATSDDQQNGEKKKKLHNRWKRKDDDMQALLNLGDPVLGPGELFVWQSSGGRDNHIVMDVCDTQGERVFCFERPDDPHRMAIYDQHGRVIGRAMRTYSLRSMRVKLTDAEGRKLLWIAGPRCKGDNMMLRVTRRKNVLGCVRRNWPGWRATNAVPQQAVAVNKCPQPPVPEYSNIYDVKFPDFSDARTRLLLLAGTILLDVEYEIQSNDPVWLLPLVGACCMAALLPAAVVLFPFGLFLLLIPLPLFFPGG